MPVLHLYYGHIPYLFRNVCKREYFEMGAGRGAGEVTLFEISQCFSNRKKIMIMGMCFVIFLIVIAMLGLKYWNATRMPSY